MRSMTKGLLVLVGLGAGVVFAAGRGWFGSHEGPGEIRGPRRSSQAVAEQGYAVHDAAEGVGASAKRQILFGDLHVHTTASFDAFMTSMPMLNGEGAHPQADACDYARHCSALDFWSINDHAEALTRRNWDETVESIRECNAIAGDPSNPDTVAYLGWEWTQVGATPEKHWGHKNVVLRGLDDSEVPSRPIAAASVARLTLDARPGLLSLAAISLFGGDDRYDDLSRYFAERRDAELCDPGTPVRELPDECIDAVEDPRGLFDRLDEWGLDSIVIPHGTTWGMYTPAAADWKKQITRAQHDPDRQTLIEVYSGHGNSEQYRDWRAVDVHSDGTVSCPEPTPTYLPSCWQAGELIRERCLAEDESPDECEARAEVTRQLAANAGGQAHFTVPGYQAEAWLDAGQCRDCDVPAFNYRPGGSAQYILALRDFEGSGEPMRARFGFMASSDNHKARPGNGFKEVDREAITESRAQTDLSGILASNLRRPDTEPQPEPVAFDREATDLAGFQLFEMERQASFFMTGGLIAAHAAGRDRDAIWQAMQRREVYGTTGPRILLWFDLLNAPGSRGREVPMGGEVAMRRSPIFRVRAVGSFEQQSGCPQEAFDALGTEGVERICASECYYPTDRRRLVTRIEVVRIQPQLAPGEPVAKLIEDPWRVHECEPDPAGCSFVFSDPDFERDGRDTLYYARAVEAPVPTINAGGLRCREGAVGECVEVDVCGLDGDTSDECLTPAEPRAWSSPIFVDWATGSS